MTSLQPSVISKFLREPLLHFFLIGAAIYIAFGLTAENTAGNANNEKTVLVSAGEVEWMQASWEKRWNRPPTPEELDGVIQQYIRESVLYQEALTMGLNKHDQVIRRRLAQKLEFLARDLVTMTQPTDEELLEFFEANLDRYQEPTRYTFTQVFFDPDKRGDKTLDDATAAMDTLAAQNDALENAGALGDGLMLQTHYPMKDASEIAKQFGSGFTESLVELKPKQWHGPILSGYGVHLVYVSSINEPLASDFLEVRDRVVQDWVFEKSEEFNEEFYAKLRDQYTIVIEEPAVSNQAIQVTEQ